MKNQVKEIKCQGIIDNPKDIRHKQICNKTLAKRINDQIYEIQCPICKKKTIIKAIFEVLETQ